MSFSVVFLLLLALPCFIMCFPHELLKRRSSQYATGRNRRYFGGSVIRDGVPPFQSTVPIFITGEDPANRPICTGIVIASRFVLTAAHCVYGEVSAITNVFSRADIHQMQRSANSRVSSLRIGRPERKSYCDASTNEIAFLPKVTKVRVIQPFALRKHDVSVDGAPTWDYTYFDLFDLAVLQLDEEVASQFIANFLGFSNVYPMEKDSFCNSGGYGWVGVLYEQEPPSDPTIFIPIRHQMSEPGENCGEEPVGTPCGSIHIRGGFQCRHVDLETVNCTMNPKACVFCLCHSSLHMDFGVTAVSNYENGLVEKLDFTCRYPDGWSSCRLYGGSVKITSMSSPDGGAQSWGVEAVWEGEGFGQENWRGQKAGRLVGTSLGDSGGPLYCFNTEANEWLLRGVIRGRFPVCGEVLTPAELKCLHPPNFRLKEHIKNLKNANLGVGAYKPVGEMRETIQQMIEDMNEQNSPRFGLTDGKASSFIQNKVLDDSGFLSPGKLQYGAYATWAEEFWNVIFRFRQGRKNMCAEVCSKPFKYF